MSTDYTTKELVNMLLEGAAIYEDFIDRSSLPENQTHWREQANKYRAAAALIEKQQARITALEHPPPTHHHKSRNSYYVLIGIGKMQSSHWLDGRLAADENSVDMREVAVYQSTDDAQLWVRPREEWEDGRFASLPGT